jgi:hypothetical protein
LTSGAERQSDPEDPGSRNQRPDTTRNSIVRARNHYYLFAIGDRDTIRPKDEIADEKEKSADEYEAALTELMDEPNQELGRC